MSAFPISKEEFKSLAPRQARYQQLINKILPLFEQNPEAIFEIKSDDGKPIWIQRVKSVVPPEYRVMGRKKRIFIIKK